MIRKFLDNEMFRRVIKVYKEEKLSSDQPSSNATGDTSQSNTPRSVRQRKTKTTATVESTTTTTKDDDTKEKDKAKKKKFKFELHEEQTFIDSHNEFYVWIYSPTTIKQYIMGALLVIGCIGVCLFPLWPAEVRTGVYYLSLVLASLLGLLLSLAVIKYILFAGVWLLTMGKIKFWLLPNLTEDVGFIESFIPLYTLNVTTKKKTSKNDEKKENVEEEEEEEEEEKTTNEKENLNEENKKTSTSNVVGPIESEQDDEDKEKSTSRSSSIDEVEDGNKPQKSSDEDFEVLSKDELETK
jgi:translocation protein SEC62